ncbi:hypothetical protein COU77_03020 [Candidatus Peregrinibacteria bacterium CG10_big_fil_rev_8_21_14_0_10_49_16]|nr:MAG: hypothetical protein COW95_02535 [Candidatus Peregrinibacteria bacterium CG22_combo_CG10-13_8_21_14_all_49_11]PIR52005.1 MAG: hypothetical protein COU77_03020 [Candidatus Peregrinibacteria bacterium CG10_big_fil_rev_8_21_14_0_10_49_16]
MSEDTLLHIQELLESATSSLKTANTLLRDLTGISDINRERHTLKAHTMSGTGTVDGKVVEGVFDGQNMIDANGESYPVPANYASKSKLVEGDGMKLTITEEGKFIYKQIAPIERKTVQGTLIQEDGQYKVLANGKTYRVLLASVTFYRAEVGDRVTILLPKTMEATWGTVEAVIPKHLADIHAQNVLGVRPQEADDGELSPDLVKE